jgi:hypothetical protein
MYSQVGSLGEHPGGRSIGGMVTHWTALILEPGMTTNDTSEFDIISRWMVDIVFRQYLQEYVRKIIAGQRTVEQLEIELNAMRSMFAVNWMNMRTDGMAFAVNAHGHSLKSCYDNLNNPMYRHTGHSAAHHKCLWEYYLGYIVPGGDDYLPPNN